MTLTLWLSFMVCWPPLPPLTQWPPLPALELPIPVPEVVPVVIYYDAQSTLVAEAIRFCDANGVRYRLEKDNPYREYPVFAINGVVTEAGWGETRQAALLATRTGKPALPVIPGVRSFKVGGLPLGPERPAIRQSPTCASGRCSGGT